MDDWIFDENNHVVSDGSCNIVMYNAQKNLQGMTNNTRFTSSVGDTTRAVYN